MDIYKKIPELENERFLLRKVKQSDADDLLRVYSDKNALPFFNSDNCDGDNFYYATIKSMEQAMAFWESAYKNRWFARLSVVDKSAACAIGTAELCLRVSDDRFNNTGILRLDVRSDYENGDALYSILSLITPHIADMLGCSGIITKAPIYAVERIKAISQAGFKKSEHFLVGKTGYKYDGYWIINQP